MAYEINKSDGTTITINDGQINNADSNVQLIGRNRADYGAPIAQNFVRMLENFAAESAPNDNPNISGDPLPGQLWYKPSTNALSVYNGTGWDSILSAGGAGAGTLEIDGVTAATVLAVTVGTSAEPVATLFATEAEFAGGIVTISDTGDVVINPPAGLTVDTITGSGGEVTINSQLNVDTINIAGAYTLDNNSIGESGTRVPTGFFNVINANTAQIGSYSSQTPGVAINIPDGLVALNNGVTTNALVAAGGSATMDGDFTMTAGSQILADGAGNTFGGDWTIDGTWTVNGAIELGTGTVEANYADIAERFAADQVYSVGTVVAIGGDKEVTETTESYSDDIFGIVADNPAFILNNKTQQLDLMPAITLVGRTPVRVIGKVNKGDRMTSSDVAGVAQAADKSQLTMFNYVGRALEDKTTEDESLIWVAFGAK